MPRFQYKAVAPGGDITEGEMDAPDRAAVIAKLQAEHHLPIRAEEIGRAEPAGVLGRIGRQLTAPLPARGRLRQRHAAAFARSLATLLGAGLPLDRALSVMQEVASPGRERDLVRFVLERVRSGAPLSAVLAARGELFGRFAVSLVRAGEAGGQLGEALERLAAHQERAREVRETVRSALVYPVILLIVAVASVALLLVFVIPQFEELFRDGERELPLPTQVVFGIAAGLREYGWLLLLAVAAATLAIQAWSRRPDGRKALDRWRLGVPLLGDLVRKIETERLSRSLSTLVASGVPLPNALALASEALGNRVMAAAVSEVAARVTEGASFARMLAETGRFPTLAVQLVRVGEETGKLQGMLLQIAEIYAREIQETVKRLLTLIEPVLIVGLGIVVAGIILSVLAAIVGLNALAL